MFSQLRLLVEFEDIMVITQQFQYSRVVRMIAMGFGTESGGKQ
jgi:hypothetical protein